LGIGLAEAFEKAQPAVFEPISPRNGKKKGKETLRFGLVIGEFAQRELESRAKGTLEC